MEKWRIFYFKWCFTSSDASTTIFGKEKTLKECSLFVYVKVYKKSDNEFW